MATPLLTTKLYIPPVRPDPSTGLRTRMVPRPRLIEQMDLELRMGHKLTLVSAPAGFGKTTLLSECAALFCQLDNPIYLIDNSVTD
jgi:LuxR family maltose regulon positive regulatory protein